MTLMETFDLKRQKAAAERLRDPHARESMRAHVRTMHTFQERRPRFSSASWPGGCAGSRTTLTRSPSSTEWVTTRRGV